MASFMKFYRFLDQWVAKLDRQTTKSQLKGLFFYLFWYRILKMEIHNNNHWLLQEAFCLYSLNKTVKNSTSNLESIINCRFQFIPPFWFLSKYTSPKDFYCPILIIFNFTIQKQQYNMLIC